MVELGFVFSLSPDITVSHAAERRRLSHPPVTHCAACVRVCVGFSILVRTKRIQQELENVTVLTLLTSTWSL